MNTSKSKFMILTSLIFCIGFTGTLYAQTSLQKAYEDAFMVGTALNRAQILSDVPDALTDTIRQDRRGYFVVRNIIPDSEGLSIAGEHFKAVTPENVMKWEEIHPAPGMYDFEAADYFVEWAEANDKFISAHTLIWHSQTPDWVFLDEEGNEISREALIERMRDHIHTIVGRYKGKIDGWDVVNEAFNEDGSYRESKWYQIIGEDFIAKAFEFAREADPDVELYYNDYRMENPEKRAGIITALQKMLDAGVPITGVGSQSHFMMSRFPEYDQVEASITDLAELGIDVMITELDINVLPSGRNPDGSLNTETDIYQDGLPEEVEAELTQKYRDLFEIYLRHKNVLTRVTLWGVSDGGSWLNYLPSERVNYPLLFDRNNDPKPAFKALIELANEHSSK